MPAPVAITRYHPEADQRALVATFDRPLDALLPLARLHRVDGDRADVWAGLAELGLFGIAVGEDAGGAGLGAVEEALLAERLGRRLAPPAVFATLAAVHAGAPEAVAAMTAGASRAAPGYSTACGTVIVNGADADLVLLRTGKGITLHRLATGEAMEAVDGRLWTTSLKRGDPGDLIATLDDAAILRARLIDAAALAGIAGAALDMAVAYAKIREQFGRPIGAFQAIKHHCANMAMAARAAIDQVTFAATAADDVREDQALQVEAALLLAIDAAIGNARLNIQVHGGIGFSDEADPHLLLKRAHLQATIAGGREAAAARLAAEPRAL